MDRQWGVAWFSKLIINYIAVITSVPFRLMHDSFCLGLGRPDLRSPVGVLVTL